MDKKKEVRVMNKKTAWRIKGSIPTSVAVVKNSNGTDLSSHDVSHLPQWLNRKYFVPSPTDMIQRSILQRVYVLSPDKLSQLLKMKPVHIDCADDMVLSFSDDIFSTVCVDNSPISDATESNHVFSHIFIGADTPDTSVMASYTLTDVGVIVFAGPMKYVDIKEYHPVSVSLVDPLFHPRVINERERNLLVNAVGNQGSFPTRNIGCSQGSVSYFGKRGVGSRSGISPTEGPGMSAVSSYYRQNTDARYLPGVLHSVNELASSATKHSMKLVKGSRIFCSTQTNHLEICSIGIRTSDYAVSSHIDKTDRLSKSAETGVLNRWKQMLDVGTLHPHEQRSLQCQYNFCLEFGTGVHATCGYQYPSKAKITNEEQTVPLNLFLFPTLGISKRMHNFVSHVWMAHVAQHATAVPMFLERNHVSFGSHPDVSVEAWGGSKR